MAEAKTKNSHRVRNSIQRSLNTTSNDVINMKNCISFAKSSVPLGFSSADFASDFFVLKEQKLLFNRTS